jgi:hypothetical protein
MLKQTSKWKDWCEEYELASVNQNVNNKWVDNYNDNIFSPFSNMGNIPKFIEVSEQIYGI